MILIKRTKMVRTTEWNEVSAPKRALKNPSGAQRSGSARERRGSGMSELSPKAEARDMELAPTRSS